jgi:hypothetical protein
VSAPVFCKAKVAIYGRPGDPYQLTWSFCDLPPDHAGPHSFHLESERANDVVTRLMNRGESLEKLLDQARALLRGNPKAAKLVKQMNEVLP